MEQHIHHTVHKMEIWILAEVRVRPQDARNPTAKKDRNLRPFSHGKGRGQKLPVG
jgi:hypothetical protein